MRRLALTGTLLVFVSTIIGCGPAGEATAPAELPKGRLPMPNPVKSKENPKHREKAK